MTTNPVQTTLRPMPQALEVDKEQIKLVALQIGVREAARQYGLSEDTVCAWARRDGWMEQLRQAQAAQQVKIENQGLQAVARIDPVQVMAKIGNRSKLRLARTVDKTALALCRQEPEKLLKNTQALRNTTGAWKDLHGAVPSSTVNLAVQVNANQVPEA